MIPRIIQNQSAEFPLDEYGVTLESFATAKRDISDLYHGIYNAYTPPNLIPKNCVPIWGKDVQGIFSLIQYEPAFTFRNMHGVRTSFNGIPIVNNKELFYYNAEELLKHVSLKGIVRTAEHIDKMSNGKFSADRSFDITMDTVLYTKGKITIPCDVIKKLPKTADDYHDLRCDVFQNDILIPGIAFDPAGMGELDPTNEAFFNKYHKNTNWGNTKCPHKLRLRWRKLTLKSRLEMFEDNPMLKAIYSQFIINVVNDAGGKTNLKHSAQPPYQNFIDYDNDFGTKIIEKFKTDNPITEFVDLDDYIGVLMEDVHTWKCNFHGMYLRVLNNAKVGDDMQVEILYM